MKIKNILICTLAAAMLLAAGCSDEKNSSGNSGAGSNSAGNNDNTGIVSAAPPELAGFTGNVGEVSPKSGDLIATFEIEGYGTIKAVLFPEAAPLGVENFRKLADAGFYSGLNLHRVIANFMLQGGSLNGDGTGGDALVEDGSFGIEVTQNARHFYGALCYANAQGSNSTQFYIVNDKTPQDLDDIDRERYLEIIDEGKGYIRDSLAAKLDLYADYYRFQTQYYQTTLDWFDGASDEIRAAYLERGGTPFLDGNYTVFGQVYEGFDVIDAISAAEVTVNSGGEMSKPVQEIIIKSVTVSEV